MRTPVLISCAAASLAMLGCNPAPEQKAKSSAQPPAPAMMAQTDAGKPGSTTPDAIATERAGIRSRFSRLKECDADECGIIVTVTSEPCDKTKIKADPEELAVVRTRRGVLIKWEVTTRGYSFDRRDGITFKDSQNQFQCRPRNHATEYECRNKNDDRKDYQYNITLVKDGVKCTVDPTIINGY